MISMKCKYCSRIFEGHKEGQVEHQIKQHIISKHPEKVKIKV